MGRKRKKPRGKRINPTLFVFCEGETEEGYINMLKSYYRLPSIQIHTKIGGNNITSGYIKNYKKDKPTHEKDINYLMYDLDVPGLYNRLNRIDDCTLLLSNPCIELWFLLHHKSHKIQSTCKYFCDELSKRNNNYKKGIINDRLKDRLLNKTKEAIERSKRLTELNNPSTSVYKLIEELNKLKKPSTEQKSP